MNAIFEQYNAIKQRFSNSILFFQIGEFYEIFDQDAEIIASLTNITLTKKNNRIMCGIPVSKLDNYLQKIFTKENLSLAICDQLTASNKDNKLIHRDVVREITKGTYINVDEEDYNFVLAIIKCKDNFILAYSDISQKICFIQYSNKHNLLSDIQTINPTEIISLQEIEILNHLDNNILIYSSEDLLSSNSEEKKAIHLLQYHYQKHGYSFHPYMHKINNAMFLNLNHDTIVNLDLIQPNNSLLKFLDYTNTAQGKRILKYNITHPLAQKKIINLKLECIEFFKKYLEHNTVTLNIKDLSKTMYYLYQITDIYDYLQELNRAQDIIDNIQNLPFYLNIKKSNLNKLLILKYLNYFDSQDKQLNLQNIKTHYQQLQEMEGEMENYNKSQQDKVKYLKSLGYFMEGANLPAQAICKQKNKYGYKYTNNTLLDLEYKINNIKDNIQKINMEYFHIIKKEILQEQQNIINLMNLIGEIDYFISMATVAKKYQYCKPSFTDNPNYLNIAGGTHPYVKAMNKYICNDFKSDMKNRLFIITGANMSGKSTFMRQNALIVLLAHMGSFVPAKKAEMQIFDGLFVRLGAKDNIYKNQSTFLLEMNECAEIVNASSKNSLIFLDEVGRGTSFKEGASICIAIIEYLHDVIRGTVIISTHYKEIENYLKPFSAIVFLYMLVAVVNNNIEYKYKIIRGIEQKSYAIESLNYTNLPSRIAHRSNYYLQKIIKL